MSTARVKPDLSRRSSISALARMAWPLQALETLAEKGLRDHLDYLGEREGRVGETKGEAAGTVLDYDVVVDYICPRRDGGGVPHTRLVDEGLRQGKVEGQVLVGLGVQADVSEGNRQV